MVINNTQEYRKRLVLIVIFALMVKVLLFSFSVVYAPGSKLQNDSHDYIKTGEALSTQGIFGIENKNGSFEYEIYRTPGYPIFLAFFHGLLNIPLEGILFLQIILSLLVAFFTYKTAKIIDRRIAFLSATIILFDLPITIFSLVILSETLFLFLMSLFMYAFIIYLKNKKIKTLILSAVILAIATYVRPISYYLGIVIALIVVFTGFGKGTRKVIIQALVFLIVVYSIIGIWHYRNYIRFKEPVFSSVSSSDIQRFSIFKSYERNKQTKKITVSPLRYYINIAYRSLTSFMTEPGTLKDFKCQALKILGKIIGYPWMVFWLAGFLFAITKIRKNVYYKVMLIITLYFMAVSSFGVTLLVDERFRVPVMPFIAIISTYGWIWLYPILMWLVPLTMVNYIIRRLLGIVPLALGITIISFMIIHLAPGKPTTIQQSLNPKVSLETRERLDKLYGLDKPLHIQYVNWLNKLIKFDFGRSFGDDRPVIDKILERIPVTLTINLLSLLLVFLIAIPLGVKSAINPNQLFDKTTTIFVFLGFAMPTFWLALILMNLFGIQLGWLPISGIKSLDFEYFSGWTKFTDMSRHLFLPVAISSVGGLAGVSRYMRSSMIEALNQPYIYTARAKGLSENSVVYKHALRNAILPIVTILGLSIPGLLGGSVIFESIFALPGIGRLFYEAVMMRDYPLIMAEVVLGAILTMLGNLIADIAYAYVDPRIKYKK
jgi:peptide/nickel transport system permease protein